MIGKIYDFLKRTKGTEETLNILSFILRYFKRKKITKLQLTNIEEIEHMYINKYAFSNKNKKKGISGVLRTKNGEIFLTPVIESCIKSLDELIVVENEEGRNSKTQKIILELQKKYPNKIKYYQYPYKIYRRLNIDGRSIHSLAYFYNRCFSKTTYNIVGKIDDDNLYLKNFNIFLQKIRNSTKIKQKQSFYYYRGYNIIKGKDYLVPSNNIFSGRNGDIGFYEQTEYTYYIQNGDTEILYNDKLYIPLGFCYLHLKYLKPNFGLENAPEKKKELWKANIISSKKVPIEKITKDFSTTMIKKIIDPILNRNYLSKKGNEE